MRVFNEDQKVVSEALVRLRNDASGAEFWNTAYEKNEVAFDRLKPGPYRVEASAAGYRTESLQVRVDTRTGNHVVIVLKRDALKTASTSSALSTMPPDAQTETERGIAALKLDKLSEAEQHFKKAYKQAPACADLNYLMGILFSRKPDLAKSQEYLANAIATDPRHVRAMALLGAVRFQLKDTPGAMKVLEQAVSIDPQDWTAHWLLANGYLEQKEFERSRQQAELAIETGKGAGNAAQLPLGQALASLGRVPEAITALEGFLRDVPASPAVPEVQRLITELKTAAQPAAAVQIPPALIPAPRLPLPSWEPLSVDDVQPPIATGVTCPESLVIDGASQRVQEFATDLSRFEATEDVIQEDLDELGKPVTNAKVRFSYVASFSLPFPGRPRVDEDRGAPMQVNFPEGLETRGLPGLVFIFYPGLRDNYELRCEGLGEWKGQATWLVHFRQREGRPSILRAYVLRGRRRAVDLKGRVWISADTFHIVHLQAELVHAMPEIRLLSEHALLDYGRVTFTKKHTALWLPQRAELYFHFRGHRYRRTHAFDNYRLFSVDSTQEIFEPKVQEQP